MQKRQFFQLAAVSAAAVLGVARENVKIVKKNN